MFAQLGDVAFELLGSFASLEETHAAQFAQHDVLAGRPRLQAMGNALTELRFSLKLHWKLGDVDAAYHGLIAAKEAQQAVSLVYGTGRFVGWFVIERLTARTLQMDKNGRTAAREIDVELKEFVGDPNNPLPAPAVVQGEQNPLLAMLPESMQTALNPIAEKIGTAVKIYHAVENDIRKAGEALAPAPKRRIHTFIATSPIHMEHKLKMKPKQVVEAAVKAVKIAKEYTDDVEFSAEDAVRSEHDFLVEIFTAVIEAGATTINIPDTVGYSIPSAWYERIRAIINSVPNSSKVVWSSHCHNDLGMAVANSLAAIQAGARQIECTINGLGERAGNASLEEIVMALKVRHDLFGLETGIDTAQIVPTSKLVSTITGYPVQPNKAIVGANAFSHESGIHQDGVLKHRETYEIMSAESVGWAANRLTLGKLSGRNAFKTKLQELGIELGSEEALNAAFARFKEVADKKREIFDEDLHALISDEMSNLAPDRYKFISQRIVTETGEPPIAQIVFSVDGVEQHAEATGSGPVDAVFKAIESVANSGATLELYSVNAITKDTESQGETTVRLSKNGKIVNGQGADTDVLIATTRAYLSALSKLDKDAKVKAQGI